MPTRKPTKKTQSAKRGTSYWTDRGGATRVVIWLNGDVILRPNRSFKSRNAAAKFVKDLRAALAT